MIVLFVVFLNDLACVLGNKIYPEFTRVPHDVYILPKTKPANRNQLECSGRNAVTIQWKCNGKVIPSNRYQISRYHDKKNELITSATLAIERQRVEEYFGPEDFWCVCVLKGSDSYEKSKKAYIRLAYLETRFHKPYPEDGGVKLGDDFLLDCRPPVGVPKPIVTWFKDGEEIRIDFVKYKKTETGDLIVMHVDTHAAGNYTCRASNVAGVRETPAAVVWIYANGGWSEWSSWSRCETHHFPCGIGTKRRRRECNNPAPLNGKNCRGPLNDEEECTKACENQSEQSIRTWPSSPTGSHSPSEAIDNESNLIMIACLTGVAGIALVIFVVIFIYLKSKNNFTYLKKTVSQKKPPFNANHDFDLIRTQNQVDARQTNRKDGTLERLLYRPDSHSPNSAYKPAYNPVYKEDFGTRSSSGVSTDPSDQSRLHMMGTMPPSDQPIYHSIIPNAMPGQQPPPTQNYNYNSNYPTYAYPNPYQPR